MCDACKSNECCRCTYDRRNAAKLEAKSRRVVYVIDADLGHVVVCVRPDLNERRVYERATVPEAARLADQLARDLGCINAAAPLQPVGTGKAVTVPEGFRVVRAMPAGRVIRMRTTDHDWHVHSRHDSDIGFRLAWQTLIDDPMILEA
jgi:hypothetical protein